MFSSATRAKLASTALLEYVPAPAPQLPLSQRSREGATERVLAVRKANALPPPAPVEEQMAKIELAQKKRAAERPLSHHQAGSGAIATPSSKWDPPNDAASRAEALGPDPHCHFSHCWGCFEDLPTPAPSDWLGRGSAGQRDRPGQPFYGTGKRSFLFSGAHRSFPDKRRSNILLVPLGDVSGAPPAETLMASLSATYFGMKVILAEPSPELAHEYAKLVALSEVEHHLPDWVCSCTFHNSPSDAECKVGR